MQKVAVFTSNQPRHIALLQKLADSGFEVRAVVEANGLQHIGVQVSSSRRRYLAQMFAAEAKYFGNSTLTPSGIRTLSIPMGYINSLEPSQLTDVLDCDRIVVFGSDYIKGWLINELVDRKALNIHLGISPYFRGGACNFWALFDGFPNHVGATIHLLSTGLDSGAMLFHALPTFKGESPFEFTMKAVAAAHDCLTLALDTPLPAPVDQDRSLQIRYSRSTDFNDEVIDQYFAQGLSATDLGTLLESSPKPRLVRPHYF